MTNAASEELDAIWGLVRPNAGPLVLRSGATLPALTRDALGEILARCASLPLGASKLEYFTGKRCLDATRWSGSKVQGYPMFRNVLLHRVLWHAFVAPLAADQPLRHREGHRCASPHCLGLPRPAWIKTLSDDDMGEAKVFVRQHLHNFLRTDRLEGEAGRRAFLQTCGDRLVATANMLGVRLKTVQAWLRAGPAAPLTSPTEKLRTYELRAAWSVAEQSGLGKLRVPRRSAAFRDLLLVLESERAPSPFHAVLRGIRHRITQELGQRNNADDWLTPTTLGAVLADARRIAAVVLGIVAGWRARHRLALDEWAAAQRGEDKARRVQHADEMRRHRKRRR